MAARRVLGLLVGFAGVALLVAGEGDLTWGPARWPRP
jgi:hypothetical protein